MTGMGSLEKTERGSRAVVRDAGRLAHSVYDRSRATLRRLVFRLSRPVPVGMPPVWTPQMTTILLVSGFSVLFLGIFDPYFRPFSGPAPNGGLQFLRGITDVAKSGPYIVVSAIVLLVIGLVDWRAFRQATHRRMVIAYGRAAFILVAIAVPGITVNIVKQFVGRARPRMFDEVGVYAFEPFRFDHAFQGFPSGHATTAGSLAVLLMIWHPRWRLPLFLAMAVLACGRIPAGAHYPSDVAAGFALGAIMTLVLARWFARHRAVFSFRNGNLLPVLTGK